MTLKAYALPKDLDQDIETYAGEVDRFRSGAILPGVFKARRVPRGIYEQRKDGTYMARVRVAGGYITGVQMRLLADLAKRYANGQLHVTTRQDIQFHDVSIENTVHLMRELKSVGLTTKGGGGNTVRNITACPYAGVCPHELFDVSPFVQEVTEFLIPLTGSYNLPRKYKIAFSGCGTDCALAGISDLGFISKMHNNEPGFALFAGGGMGAHSRVADLLVEWIPASDAIIVAEAVRRLFDRLGDRQNRHRARLRFVFDKIGVDAFRIQFDAEIKQLRKEAIPGAGKPQVIGTPSTTTDSATHPALHKVSGLNCLTQQQQGFSAVNLYLPMGMISSANFEKLAGIAENFSQEKALRTTRSQNLLLRFVPDNRIQELAATLKTLSIDVTGSTPLSRFIACAGASTCRLGLCLSRNAVRACANALADGKIDANAMNAVEIYVSGCPNSCGQHPSAPVGLSGSALRVGGHLVPAYQVALGGRHDAVKTRLAENAGTVPAYALPAFMTEMLGEFQRSRTGSESFTAYYERTGIEHFKNLIRSHSDVPAYADNKGYYRDFGQDEEFSLAGRGAGECGAGVFEVIREDIATAKKTMDIPETERKPDTLFNALLATVRALLITRGIDTRDSDALLREFEKHFVDTSLVDAGCRGLLSKARGYLQGWATALDGAGTEILSLLERVELLFSTLDANLAFHPPEKTGQQAAASSAKQPAVNSHPDQQMDLSGVTCPMNFVKAKLRLETMDAGSTLSVILDDGEPIQNVPASLKGEGHEILETTALSAKSWRILVRKI